MDTAHRTELLDHLNRNWHRMAAHMEVEGQDHWDDLVAGDHVSYRYDRENVLFTAMHSERGGETLPLALGEHGYVVAVVLQQRHG